MHFKTICLCPEQSDLFKSAIKTFRPKEQVSTTVAESLLGRKDHVYIVAVDEAQKICGWAITYEIQRFTHKELFFFEIDVAEPCRRQGIARELIEGLKDHCRNRAIKEMFVMTDHRNKAAMALYAATGASPAVADSILFSYATK